MPPGDGEGGATMTDAYHIIITALVTTLILFAMGTFRRKGGDR